MATKRKLKSVTSTNTEHNTLSGNISIFPAVKRGADYIKESKYISEANLIKLVNHLLDKESFIVGYDYGDGASPIIKFNLNGYYIVIANMLTILSAFSSSNNIYVQIQLDSSDGYTELVGQDSDDGEYKAVTFTDSPNSETGYYYLKLLTKTKSNNVAYGDSGWYIPNESIIRYDAQHIDSDSIIAGIVDGGEI